MTRIAVIDHGAGNLVSMEQALRQVNAEPTRIDQETDLSDFDGVILPGVGATGAAMRTLARRGLVQPLNTYAGPLLGVCVGMQLLFDRSDEDDNPCLGLIPGNVTRLRATPLPHMGWNEVDGRDEPLLVGVAPEQPFYFVHSFAVRPEQDAVITGTTTCGSDVFASIVRSGHIVGMQFHPERSGADGLAVLANFVNGCSAVRRVA